MIIKDIHISGFGQFHNKDFSFKKGINLISGHNESGKSTINSFISHMLYGMNRGRGKASKTDDYTRYCPWNYPDSFGGSMRIEVNGTNYLIERNFSASGKSFLITNERTGKSSNDEAVLDKLTQGISENAFNCTLNIKDAGFNNNDDMSELIKKHILNIGCSSSVNINVPLAVKNLTAQKKKLISEIDPNAKKLYYEADEKLADLNTTLNQKFAEIASYAEYTEPDIFEPEPHNIKLLSDISKLQSDYNQLKGELEKSGFINISDINQIEDTHNRLLNTLDINNKKAEKTGLSAFDTDGISIVPQDIIHGSIFSVLLTLAFICFTLSFKIGGILLVAAAIAALVYTGMSIAKRYTSPYPSDKTDQDCADKLSALYKKYIGTDQVTPESKTHFCNFISDIKAKFVQLDKLKALLDDSLKVFAENINPVSAADDSILANSKLYWESDNIQKQIDSLEEEKARLSIIIAENLKLKKEIEALDLAINTIKEISSDMHIEHAPELNQMVSQTFNMITQKNYGELSISENMNITLNDGVRTIPIESLSQGTIEQIYMSLRLSAAELLFNSTEFPLIIDEAFSKYDNPRLAQTLKAIDSSHNGQTFILSCQNRERLIMEKIGLPFNHIKL